MTKRKSKKREPLVIERYRKPMRCPWCNKKGITRLIKKRRHEYYVCKYCKRETKSTGRWIHQIGREAK